ncbi:MAG: hypothetical protein EOO41_04865, partial [Methanobacteriota archaeon]
MLQAASSALRLRTISLGVEEEMEAGDQAAAHAAAQAAIDTLPIACASSPVSPTEGQQPLSRARAMSFGSSPPADNDTLPAFNMGPSIPSFSTPPSATMRMPDAACAFASRALGAMPTHSPPNDQAHYGYAGDGLRASAIMPLHRTAEPEVEVLSDSSTSPLLVEPPDVRRESPMPKRGRPVQWSLTQLVAKRSRQRATSISAPQWPEELRGANERMPNTHSSQRGAGSSVIVVDEDESDASELDVADYPTHNNMSAAALELQPQVPAASAARTGGNSLTPTPLADQERLTERVLAACRAAGIDVETLRALPLSIQDELLHSLLPTSALQQRPVPPPSPAGQSPGRRARGRPSRAA